MVGKVNLNFERGSGWTGPNNEYLVSSIALLSIKLPDPAVLRHDAYSLPRLVWPCLTATSNFAHLYFYNSDRAKKADNLALHIPLITQIAKLNEFMNGGSMFDPYCLYESTEQIKHKTLTSEIEDGHVTKKDLQGFQFAFPPIPPASKSKR